MDIDKIIEMIENPIKAFNNFNGVAKATPDNISAIAEWYDGEDHVIVEAYFYEMNTVDGKPWTKDKLEALYKTARATGFQELSVSFTQPRASWKEEGFKLGHKSRLVSGQWIYEDNIVPYAHLDQKRQRFGMTLKYRFKVQTNPTRAYIKLAWKGIVGM